VIRRNEKSFGRFGTPVYLAPEVVTDRGYSGFSSDVWSLGVMLYAMLVGDVPFQAENFRVL
jgi:serine/threonine protein kinase